MRCSLRRPWCSASPASSPVSAANPTITCPGSRAATSSTRMSGLVSSGSGGGSASPFLILLAAAVGGPEVGHRGGHHHGVGALHRGPHGVAQLQRGAGPHDLHRGRIAQLGGVRGDQRDLRAALRGHRGQRVALAARRAVAEEAHRVQRLPGAAGRHHHPPALEVPRQRARPAPAAAGPARRSRPARAAGPGRCRRRSAGRTRVPSRPRRGSAAAPRCPGWPGAATSRCASPAPSAPGSAR